LANIFLSQECLGSVPGVLPSPKALRHVEKSMCGAFRANKTK
jgi:hypothetical protein